MELHLLAVLQPHYFSCLSPKRADRYANAVEGVADGGGDGAGVRAVTVQAEGVGADGYGFAGDRGNGAVLGELERLGCGLGWIGDDGVRHGARGERAVCEVAAVDEGFASEGQAEAIGGRFELAACRSDQVKIRLHAADGTGDTVCDAALLGGHVVQGTVRLDVLHDAAFGLDESLQGADLIDGQVVGFFVGQRHHAATETLQVRQAGMGADSDAILKAELDRTSHDAGVARVKAARDVSRSNISHKSLVAADLVCAEALTHVAVDINESLLVGMFCHS